MQTLAGVSRYLPVGKGTGMQVNRIIFTAAISLALGACAGSSRFDGGRFPTFGPSPLVKETPAYPPAPSAPPVGQGVPRGPATASLPPPVYPGSDPIGADAPPPPGSNVTVSELPPPGSAVSAPPSQQTERVVEPRPAATRGVGGTALVGTWNARDATGATCRMTLSSSPALDLNKASASGCANKDLARVNAWKQDGGEVYLYAAGTVVARMPASSMSGVITRSGAPLSLSR